MKRGLRWFGSCLLLALALPAFADDAKKPDAQPATDKDKAVDKLVSAGSLTGKITIWDTTERSMTLDMKVQVQELDQGVANQLANLQAQYAQAANTPTRNPQDRINRLNSLSGQIAEHTRRLYKFKEVDQKFEFNVADKVIVRLMELPPSFDDKGFAVKRSDKELKELKGTDPKLPGYKGELSDIKVDDVVQVKLVKNTSIKVDKKDPNALPPDKNAPVKLEKNIEASMIVIQSVPKSGK